MGGRDRGGFSLHVSGLSDRTTPNDVKAAFERFGRVLDVYIPCDYHTKRPRGFAYVECESQEMADEAKHKLNRATIGDRVVFVDFAQGRRKSSDEMSRIDSSAPSTRREFSRDRGDRGGYRRSRSRSRSRDRDRRRRSRSRSRSRSPYDRKRRRSVSRSPVRSRRDRSSSRDRDRRRRVSRSRSRSPVRRRSPGPSRRSPSPPRRRSPTPPKRSPSPARRRSPTPPPPAHHESPQQRRSPSPRNSRSPSPHRNVEVQEENQS